MTDWNLVGRPPPSTAEEWTEEFEKYKLSPEFKWKNFDITMEDFKFIWYMEYIHRMWGRSIGTFYYIPAAIFWMKGMLTPALKKRVLLMGGLLGFQGLLGWYMVKSGLEHENFLGPNDVPRVSQYRLAAHLSSAVVLYSLLFWNAKDILFPAFKIDPSKVTPALAQLRKMVISSKALVFLTLVSGRFNILEKYSKPKPKPYPYFFRSICCWPRRRFGLQQLPQVCRQVDSRRFTVILSGLEEHH